MFGNRKHIVACVLLLLVATGSVLRADWKFVLTDDSRASGGSNFKNNGVSTAAMEVIAKAIANEPGVELVIFPGDMVLGGSSAPDAAALKSELDTWKTTMKPVYDKHIPVYVTRGNHEFYSGRPRTTDISAQPFKDLFGNPNNGPEGEQGLTFSFTHKNATFIGFDQYIHRAASYNPKLYAPGSNQGQCMDNFVIQAIKNSTSPINFAFAHEMLTSTQSHPDSMANDPNSRDALVAALAAHNGAYLCGHDHMYRRADVSVGTGNVVELTVGAAGGGNYEYGVFDDRAAGYSGPYTHKDLVRITDKKAPTFGYLLVTVHDDNSWTGEFKGFQFPNWSSNDPSVITPITIQDTFTVTPRP